ncbi:PREDICTED: protein NEN1-like [Ipomoea nil]|uniref:protein NEN1-like n=1 Tax=Ipomoea nil TaxID=35883 RepID=UPI0009009E23|nr:PREDICTED: protein NEN1-like [Ipomoea nil]
MDLAAKQGPQDLELIAFFDLETVRTGEQEWEIVEFGAILVCPRTLVQVGEPYSTLIRPSRKDIVDNFSDRPNGITRQAIANAPSFTEVAGDIYGILHGRVWAGHNIEEFDCGLIKEAYAESKRKAPWYKFLIDTHPLLRQWFGKRAGDLKLATLGDYFGHGEQKHRSLDDVSRNLKVLKDAAAVLFLESNFPNLLPENTWIAPKSISESCISATHAPFKDGSQKICILHENLPLQVHCMGMKVLYGIDKKLNEPWLSFAVVVPPKLYDVLNVCDAHALRRFGELGINSEWKPVVKEDYNRYIHLSLNDETKIWRDGHPTMERVEHTELGDDELKMLFDQEETYVDAFFSLDTFINYNKMAGITLVAKKLFIHPRLPARAI